ncbi:MAG: 3',5'-cyclic-nucleotide phosphodiesterase [Nitrospirota bacterium]
MKLKVLGCSGSEAKGHNTPGFLVNGVLMLDAGTITAALPVEAQCKITDILISHAHLDHIKSLAFLADSIIGRIKKPVLIWAIPDVIEAIKKNLMNNVLWPDFTRIPTPENPVFSYKPMEIEKTVTVAGLQVKAIPMTHPVPAVGFLVRDSHASILYSGDTGRNELLWKEAAKTPNLKAVIVDTSFPNSLDSIATLSGHFTPAQLGADLTASAVDSRISVFISHIKPVYEKTVIRELASLGRKNIRILRAGKTYSF